MPLRDAALCLVLCSTLAACERHRTPPPTRSRDAGRALAQRDASPPPPPPPHPAVDVVQAEAPAVWTRTGAPPSLSALRALFLRGLGAEGEVMRLERPHPLGDGRFVTIVKSFAPGDPEGYIMDHAAFVSTGPAGAQVEAMVRLPTTELGASRDCLDDAIHDLSVRDVDHDGEREVALVFSYCTPARPALGEVQYRDLMVLDVDPTPRVAAALHLTEAYPSCADTATYLTHQWRDLNADGHPDLVLVGERCVDDPDGGTVDPHCNGGMGANRCCEATRAEYLWSAATDGWPAQLRFVRPRPLIVPGRSNEDLSAPPPARTSPRGAPFTLAAPGP